MNKYNIHFDGRWSGHEGETAHITAHKARLGEELGLSQLVTYQAHGYAPADTLRITLHYEDGMVFQAVVGVEQTPNGNLRFEHCSNNPLSRFVIYCTKEVK